MNGSNEVNTQSLPVDAVALMVWMEHSSQPLTVVVTKRSWEMNRDVIANDGGVIDTGRVYEFESPTDRSGRKTVFYLQGVVGFAANFSTGIMPVSG